VDTENVESRIRFQDKSPRDLADLMSAFDVIATVHGARAMTLESAFAEVARGFAFPDYFGSNWPAFDECLSDLGWIPSPSYLLVVRADLLLIAESGEERNRFISMLERASRRWDEPALLGTSLPHVTFRSIFIGTSSEAWIGSTG